MVAQIDRNDMYEIRQKVVRILVDKLGLAESEVTPDANFVKDLGLDSLDYSELIMNLEQTFDIKILDYDTDAIQTIDQAVQYIESKLNQ